MLLAMILLAWMFLSVAVAVGLIIALIIGIRSGASAPRLMAGTAIGFSIHIILVCFSIYPLFTVVWSLNHAHRDGVILTSAVGAVALFVEVLYGVLVFSYCTYLAGRARPWPLKLNLK
jgi:hypothetical protein